MMKRLLVLIVLASSLAAPARAQSLRDVVDVCRDSGEPEELCRGLDHLIQLPGVLCREVAGGQSCTPIDDQQVDEAAVDAHERSWLERALAHQRALDDDLPLRNELWVHTHNSYNADAYPQTFYGLDPNQLYSITDQLRMGIRAIEIDVHWMQHPDGAPENGFNAVVVCHGGVGPAAHFGCGVNDPLLSERLEEVRAWMDDNPTEVVLLYLENNLDDDRAAHRIAAKAVDGAFGPLVHKPSKRCAPLPMETTRRQIREAGHRLLITGNCGPGAWGRFVHERGPLWKERGIGYGDDFPAYPCTAERNAGDYDTSFIRRYGDETGLSSGANAGGDVTVADARNMIRCGVDMPGLDNLVPFDERLAAFVWSWAPGEPKREMGCAVHGPDARFRSSGCAKRLQFACRTTQGGWIVTRARGKWTSGDKRCAQVGGVFDVPRTGWDNELLRIAKTGNAEVWLRMALSASL